VQYNNVQHIQYLFLINYRMIHSSTRLPVITGLTN